MSVFSDRLKQYREEAGFSSAAKFARHIKINKTTYVAYEAGTRKPTPETIAHLACELNVSTDYLLGLRSLSEERERLIGRFLKYTLDDDEFIDCITDNYVCIRQWDSIEPLILPRADCEKAIQDAADLMKANLRLIISKARSKAMVEQASKQVDIIIESAAEELGITLSSSTKDVAILRDYRRDAGIEEYIAFRYFTGINFRKEPSGKKIWFALMRSWDYFDEERTWAKEYEENLNSLTPAERAAVEYVANPRLPYFERYIAKRKRIDYEKLMKAFDQETEEGRNRSFNILRAVYFDDMVLDQYSEFSVSDENDMGDYYTAMGKYKTSQNTMEKSNIDWSFWGVDSSLRVKDNFDKLYDEYVKEHGSPDEEPPYEEIPFSPMDYE